MDLGFGGKAAADFFSEAELSFLPRLMGLLSFNFTAVFPCPVEFNLASLSFYYYLTSFLLKTSSMDSSSLCFCADGVPLPFFAEFCAGLPSAGFFDFDGASPDFDFDNSWPKMFAFAQIEGGFCSSVS